MSLEKSDLAAPKNEKPPLPHTIRTNENLPPHVLNTPERQEIRHLIGDEASYIEQHPNWTDLRKQHEDPRTNAGYVMRQIKAFAKKSGLTHEKSEGMAEIKFSRETLPSVQTEVQKDIDRLLHNPEKHKTVSEETAQYIALLAQAQEEGDIATLSAGDVLTLVRENVWTLCYQDRVASENLLGDHGIRHLVLHNIATTEKLFDQLSDHGQKVRAIDRLITHQVMIDHDIGYAMNPVRKGVNAGDFTADKGHNVLAAKFVRQRATTASNPLAKIFKKEHLQTIHQGILEHDSPTIDFQLHNDSTETRRNNIYSAIHAADNSHVFEDKLPELLYSFPDTLKYMRLMKSAAEIGDEDLFKELKSQLTARIAIHNEYTKDDKKALTNAVKIMHKESYAFSVGRICGNKPELTIDAQGILHIRIEESAIHREVMGLFGQEQLDQLRKFVEGFTGKKRRGKEEEKIDLDNPEIKGLHVHIHVNLKNGNAAHTTDYQERVDALITEKAFRDYHDRDTLLATRETILNTNEAPDTYALEKIREERKRILQTYLTSQ